MVDTVSEDHFLVSISKRFERFCVVITSKLSKEFQLPFVDMSSSSLGLGTKVY